MSIKNAIFVAILFIATAATAARQSATPGAQPCSLLTGPCPGHPIAFGSGLDADQQIRESQELAKKLAAPAKPQWRTKGDQYRTYNFPDGGMDMPYRLYVPTTWDGHAQLPLIVIFMAPVLTKTVTWTAMASSSCI